MKATFGLLIAALVSATTSHAATIGYTNDFSGTGANTAFPVETTDAQWALGAGGVYQNTISTTGQVVSSASIPITDAVGSYFIMEVRFTLTSLASSMATLGTNTLGFGVHGLNPTFTGTAAANAFYLADFGFQKGPTSTTTDGRLRILSQGDATGFTANTNAAGDGNTSTAQLAVTLGTTYVLRLTGVYSGSTLNMALGLFDATGTTQIGTSATASDTSPLTGTNFGLRNRTELATGSDPVIVDYDSFSIVVPEPSSALLMAGTMGSLLLRRRRA